MEQLLTHVKPLTAILQSVRGNHDNLPIRANPVSGQLLWKDGAIMADAIVGMVSVVEGELLLVSHPNLDIRRRIECSCLSRPASLLNRPQPKIIHTLI
jgi:hypothetical protein